MVLDGVAYLVVGAPVDALDHAASVCGPGGEEAVGDGLQVLAHVAAAVLDGLDEVQVGGDLVEGPGGGGP